MYCDLAQWRRRGHISVPEKGILKIKFNLLIHCLGMRPGSVWSRPLRPIMEPAFRREAGRLSRRIALYGSQRKTQPDKEGFRLRCCWNNELWQMRRKSVGIPRLLLCSLKHSPQSESGFTGPSCSRLKLKVPFYLLASRFLLVSTWAPCRAS